MTKKERRDAILAEYFIKKLVNDMEAVGYLEIMKAKIRIC